MFEKVKSDPEDWEPLLTNIFFLLSEKKYLSLIKWKLLAHNKTEKSFLTDNTVKWMRIHKTSLKNDYQIWSLGQTMLITVWMIRFQKY